MRDRNRPIALDSKLIDGIKSLDNARAVLHKAMDDPANAQGSRVYIIAY